MAMADTNDVLISASKVLSALAPGNEILLVEDNPGDADLILEMLSENGIESSLIQRAVRLSDALKRLKKPSVRAVLLDLGLPDSTGLDTLRAVLAAQLDIAVLVLTGHNNEQLGLNAVAEGAADYLVKGQITGPSLVRELRYAIERQRIKQQLRESEQFLRTSMDALTAHIAIIDPAGAILFVNKAWQEFATANNLAPAHVGEGVNYLAVCDAVTGDEAGMAKTFAEGIRAVLAGAQQSFEMEYPCHSPKEQRWFIGRVNSFPGEGPRNVSIAHENITARKLAEEALLHNTRLLQIAGKTARIGGWQVDLEHNKVYWSEEVAKIHETPSGYQPSVETGIAFYAPEWRDKIASLFGACARDGVPYDEEMEIVTAKGRRVWIRTIGEAERDESGRIIRVHGAFMDISDRKNSEAEAVRAAQEWQRTFDGTNHAIWILDKDFRVLRANKVSEQLFSASQGALIGKHCFEIVHDTDHNATDCPVFNAQKSKERGQMDLQMGDRWFEITVDPILDEQGQFDGAVHIINDITRRKQAENERARLATAVESIPESVVVTDTVGTVVYVNKGFERTTGYTRAEAIGNNISRLDGGNQEDIFYKELWDTIGRGEVWTGRFEIKRKDGSPYMEEATISPIFDDTGRITHYVGVKRDISEQIAVEKRNLQAQKLEAVGTLAGGIAHDFNNMLGIILGFGQMISDDLPEDSPSRENMDQVIIAANRAADLVRQILTFSRMSNENRKPLQMNLIVKEVVKFLRASIPTTICINDDVDSACPKVLADPTQMHQVLMNLCTNAYHAMQEQGGTLNVSLKPFQVEPDFAECHADLSEGPYVVLSVSDTGIGMSQEVLERIFDPFFTTKPQGKGTGLGLATTHGIVATHGGAIRVYSEPGKGTTFHIYLPAIKSESVEAPSSRQPIPGGSERILVVDDEPAMAHTIEKNLKRLGYSAKCMISSIEALEAFRANPYGFDLVMTDQTMPEMTGEKLCREILKLRPEMPIIINTGFSDHMTPEKAKQIGISGFLMKPAEMRQIAQLVRDVLDSQNI
jgi:PAS domain S-box-containing protein